MAKHPLNGAKDEEVLRASAEILGVLAKDPTIIPTIKSLFPDQERMQAAYDRHLSIYNEFLGGNTGREAELKASRSEMVDEIVLFHGCANLVAVKDPSIPQRVGVTPPPSPTAKRSAHHLLAATDFRITYEGNKMIARASAVKWAKSYEVSYCEGDPLNEANWKHLVSSSRVNRIELTGLTPGKVYYFRIRGIASCGNGPWSNFISMMAI